MLEYMNILGVDPGISGAMVLMSPRYEILEIEDIPSIVDKVVNGKPRKNVNYKALQNMLYIMLAEHGMEMIAYIEDVHSMPGQSMPAMFNMGSTFGAIKAIISCENIPIEYVSPQTWKKKLGIMGGKLTVAEKKELARALAIRNFPEKAMFFDRKKDHNRADAALIASYGVKLWHQLKN